MDAIKEVENEVDKVSRLFRSCLDSSKSKIDQLVESVEKTRRDFNELTCGK